MIAEHGDAYLATYGTSLAKAVKAGTVKAEFTTKYIDDLAKSVASYNKTAQTASKIYMTATQVAPMYETFKENGFNSTTTAVGMLAAVGGFSYTVSTSLGEVAFSNMTHNTTKDILKKGFKEYSEGITSIVTKEAAKGPNWAPNAIKEGIKLFNKVFIQKVKENPNYVFSKMVTEGIEEVSEELVQDLSIQTADNKCCWKTVRI